MANIYNFFDLLSNKRFEENALAFFKNLNPYFEYVKKDFEAAFYLQKNNFLFVFIKFIPPNTHTELPTLKESFYNTRNNPRISNGEWVVEKIYEVPFDKGSYLNKKIIEYKKTETDIDIIALLKNKI